MSIFKVNNKHQGTSFFLNALFTAITFAVVLVFNDLIDDYYKHYYDQKKMNPFLKGFLHILLILLFTFILTYAFKILFGWGDSLVG